MQKAGRISATLGGRLRLAVASTLVWIPLAMGGSAQAWAQTSEQQAVAEQAAGAGAVLVVPQQVRYAGKLTARAGETVEAVFRIYAAQEGGEPLWTETQQVPVSLDGSYTVLLGSASQSGLPQAVFSGGAARWLAVSVDRGPEPERVLLASVPYAMKSADAEALAGHAAADFVTQEQLAALTSPTSQSAASAQSGQAGSPALGSPINGNGPLTGSGTLNTVPLWTGANTQGNSLITQSGSYTGVNLNGVTPIAAMDVGGNFNVRGFLYLPPVAAATTAAGSRSQNFQFSSSEWSTTANASVNSNFKLGAFPDNNNTANPSAELDILYYYGTGGTTSILSIASTGVIKFAPTQTFPGTIKSVAATSPVTAATSSGAVTVGLNTAALETTFNSFYAQLNATNTFTGNQSITGNLTATGVLSGASSTVTGLSTATGGLLSNGAVNVKPGTLATAGAGVNSPLLEVGASAYSSTSTSAVAQNFAWQSVASGNDTASPTAKLALLFGAGAATPAATGLSIAPNGNITFSPTQVFPITGTGGGTITGITTSSPLTGSGTAGSVALGLNTAALETTLNAVYPQLATGNVFSNFLEAFQAVGPGNAAVLGWGSSGSIGAFGDSDTGYGVEGKSTSGQGVFGQVTTPAAGSQGLLGSAGVNFSSSYTSEAGIANAGVWADNSAAGTGTPISLIATGDDVYGAAIVTNGVDFPGLFVDNNGGTAGQFEASTGYGLSASTSSGTGLYGSTSASGNGVEGFNSSTGAGDAGILGIANTASATGGSYNIYAGAWGDTGTSSTAVSPAWAIGVLGTADDSHAGVFLNNSTGWSTMYVSNASTGGTGLFKTFMASSGDGTCGIGSGGSMSCTGQIKSLVSAGNGARTVETYAVQSPENWMEDFGSGVLQKGVAVVRIDPAFAETVTGDASYHVFLTPNGDSKGLYVIAKTPTTFEVRESGGGTSSLSFDYRIVAKRRGFETQRLVDVTDRLNTELRAASMTRSSGTRQRPGPMAKSPLMAALNSNAPRIAPHRSPTPMRPMNRPANTPHP